MLKRRSIRHLLIFMLMTGLGIFVISKSVGVSNIFGFPVRDYIVRQSYHITEIKNTVTAVYLNFRYFDTIIETSVLLFTTIACVYFSTFEKEEK